MEGQLTLTKFSSRRGLCLCSQRASMLLPVPVSPVMSTGIFSFATLRTTAMVRAMGGVSSSFVSSRMVLESSNALLEGSGTGRLFARRSSASTANRNVVSTGVSSIRKLSISTILSGCFTNDTCIVPITSRLMISGRAMVALRPTDESGMGPSPRLWAARSLITTGLRDEMARSATVLRAIRVFESDSTTVPSAAVNRFRNSRSAS